MLHNSKILVKLQPIFSGSLTLAEGVETEEEILHCVEYNSDLLQGFSFATPRDFLHLMSDGAEQKLADVASTNKAKRIEMVKARRLRNRLYQKMAHSIIRKLEGRFPEAFDDDERKQWRLSASSMRFIL